jgi:hypothetical protein
VGSRTHAKLADASRQAMVALVTDDEESMEDEGQDVETELERTLIQDETMSELGAGLEESNSEENYES